MQEANLFPLGIVDQEKQDIVQTNGPLHFIRNFPHMGCHSKILTKILFLFVYNNIRSAKVGSMHPTQSVTGNNGHYLRDGMVLTP